jgi:ERCC4-type nuclease
MLVVAADVREERSGVPFQLERLGVVVERRRLPIGDYIVGPETIVERKSAIDLHQTILSGRFWRQMSQLRDSASSPYLIIEGGRLWQGPVSATSVRGLCLAASDLGIAVLRTDDAYDTAGWISRLAARRRDGAIRDRPIYAQRPRRSRADSSAEQALAAAPGVSVTSARALLGRFGSLRNVVLATPEQLQEVTGVGHKRAEALTSMIHDPWPSNNSL